MMEGCLEDLDAPLRAESYPRLPQDIAEIDTEVTIPLLKNAVEAIKQCCELHCQKCEECPLARMICRADLSVRRNAEAMGRHT